MRRKRDGKKLILFAIFLVFAFALQAGAATKKEKAREEVRKTVEKVLAHLYKLQPGAKNVIEKAAGYAVFSNFGMKIFLLGGGKGRGLAHNNRTGEEVFMRMVEIQGGLGLGVKKFSLVWVFKNESDFKEFVDTGVELGAQYSASAKSGKEGAGLEGALTIRPGVWLYQLTDTGLALELTVKGTKYNRDKDLN